MFRMNASQLRAAAALFLADNLAAIAAVLRPDLEALNLDNGYSQ